MIVVMKIIKKEIFLFYTFQKKTVQVFELVVYT